MSRSDEKRAFANMLAEISDSDEEEDTPPPKGRSESSQSNPSRNSQAKSDAKITSSYSSKPNSPSPLYYEKDEDEIENFGVSPKGRGTVNESESKESPSFDLRSVPTMDSAQLNTMKNWLSRPVGFSDPTMLCYVERERRFSRTSATYRCFLESKDPNQPGRFMMTAKKNTAKSSSYYLISLLPDPDVSDRGGEAVVGKLRGNQVGSQYLLSDPGLAPDKALAPSMLRRELCLIRFSFDSGGPSSLRVWTPALSPSSGLQPLVWQPTHPGEGIEGHVERAEMGGGEGGGGGGVGSGVGGVFVNGLTYFQNKKPKWDEAHGGHVLNFKGRVTISSVKNFQMCAVDPYYEQQQKQQQSTSSSSSSTSGGGGMGGSMGGGSMGGGGVGVGGGARDEVCLQFGRVGKDRFNMDVGFPLSPLQAFGICVACMDGKLADRKGYEFLRRLTGGGEKERDPNEPTKVSGDAQGRRALPTPPSSSLSSSLASSLSDSLSLPSSQYLRDKISRTFN